MKKWLPAAVAGVVVCAGILLSAPVRKPGDFTGTWYSVLEDSCYFFGEGMISCSDGEFRGAYVFDREKVLVFVSDIQGLELEKELYLIHRRDGDYLCDNPNGDGQVYFRRTE